MKSLGPILLLLGAVLTPASGADTATTAFSVTLDGRKYDVKEGEAFTLPAGIVPGKSKLVITLSPLQHYTMGHWRFAYPSGLSVDDDRDTDSRTVTLAIAQGPQLVITDQGSDRVPKDLIVTLRTLLIERIPAKSKLLKKEVISDYSAAGRTGLQTGFTYKEEDGDEWRQRIRVLRIKGRTVSVISVAMTRDVEKAEKLEACVLDSIESAP
jgi:hypothetical protein